MAEENTQQNSGEETMEVPVSQLERMNQQMQEQQREIDELKGNQHDPTPIRETTEVTHLELSFIDGMPVVGFANKGTDVKPKYTYELPDPNDRTQSILYVDVLLYGQEQPVQIPHIELLRETEKKKCKLINTRKVPETIRKGQTPKRDVSNERYKMEEQGFEVPVEQTRETEYYTVELPDTGEQIEVHQGFVNMGG